MLLRLKSDRFFLMHQNIDLLKKAGMKMNIYTLLLELQTREDI